MERIRFAHFYPTQQPTYEIKSTPMIDIRAELQKENTLYDSPLHIQRTIERVSDLNHEIDLFTLSNEVDVAKKRTLELSINPARRFQTKL